MWDFVHGKNYLRMEIVERNADDFILESRVWLDHFTARGACDVMLGELQDWRTSLQELYESLRGEAVLSQRGLRVVISGDGTGHLIVKGQADNGTGGGHGEHALLEFTLPTLDQTYLPPVIAVLGEVHLIPQRAGGCPDE